MSRGRKFAEFAMDFGAAMGDVTSDEYSSVQMLLRP